MFKGQRFTILGTLNFRAHEDVIRSIIRFGGIFEDRVTPASTIVLSTEEMGITLKYSIKFHLNSFWLVVRNEYKLQFLPDFVHDVKLAQTYS